MIDRIEEFSDVAFEAPCLSRPIPRRLAEKSLEPFRAPMGPFVIPRRIRIEYEMPVEYRIERSKNRLMDEPISSACLVNMPELRVFHIKGRIWLGSIFPFF